MSKPKSQPTHDPIHLRLQSTARLFWPLVALASATASHPRLVTLIAVALVGCFVWAVLVALPRRPPDG